MGRTRLFVLGGAAVVAGAVAAASTSAPRTAAPDCSATILKSPRTRTLEAQAKALNDRGDVVGFADNGRGTPPHAILWPGGKTAGAIDLGVLPGYVASEAYGVNGDRVVFGLLYDKQERTFPFRWASGRMTLLKGPNGRVQPASGNPGANGRNAVNDRGEMAWTLIVGGNPRAVRWASDGKATLLPRLPGHAWSWAYGINDQGVVSGWSRKLPSEDGEENPVLWPRSGGVVALKTAPGRADGIAEATNRSGLTVGYLGNLGTPNDPESDQFAVWTTRTAAPRLMGPRKANFISEFVDVNDRGEAAGMSGTLNPKNGFTVPQPVVWRAGWPTVRPLALPAGSRTNPVLVTNLNDINNRGEIVGNVFGLTATDYSALRRIDPAVWRCRLGS